jgi:hypothetical protein
VGLEELSCRARVPNEDGIQLNIHSNIQTRLQSASLVIAGSHMF